MKIEEETKTQESKKSRKNPEKILVVHQNDNSGFSMDAYKFAAENLGEIGGKKGFEVYQYMRNFLFRCLDEPEKGKAFVMEDSQYNFLKGFDILDSAYVDNIALSLSLHREAPHLYDEGIKIIDKYVRPSKRNEGLNLLYQECGGFLAFLLQHYEGLSDRHSFLISAQLTGYSESTVERPYRRMVQKHKLGKDLPPPLILAAVYWTLHTKGVNPEEIKPFTDSNRSKLRMKNAISAYLKFTEKVLRHYQDIIFQSLQEESRDLVLEAISAVGVNLPLSEKKFQKPDAYSTFVVLCATLMLHSLPGLAEYFISQAKASK